MATAQDIVTRALQKCRVTPIGEAPQASDASHGLDALNQMMHAWKLRGVDITHSDLGLADTFPLADAYQEGTVYMLAGRLSTDYQAPRDFDADDWFRAIQAAYMTISEATMPPALTKVPSQKSRDGTVGNT